MRLINVAGRRPVADPSGHGPPAANLTASLHPLLALGNLARGGGARTRGGKRCTCLHSNHAAAIGTGAGARACQLGRLQAPGADTTGTVRLQQSSYHKTEQHCTAGRLMCAAEPASLYPPQPTLPPPARKARMWALTCSGLQQQ